MVAGVPGTGIGGIFYLLSALLMPFIELIKTFAGKSSKKRWKLVSKQMFLACGMLVGFWLTGWILGMILPKEQLLLSFGAATHKIPNVFRVESVYFSFLTLGTILLLVQIFSFLSHLRGFVTSIKK